MCGIEAILFLSEKTRDADKKVMFIPRVLFATVILAVVNSCAVSNEKSDYRLTDSTGSGLVVFSLSVSGQNSVYIAYREIGLDEQNVVYVDSYGVKGARANYDWKEPVGRLVYLELGSGDYEIYGWHPSNCGWGTPCAELQEKIYFTVVPGKASYIGNIHFDIRSRDGAYKYDINDEYDRDVSLLSTRLLNVNSDQVIKKLGKPAPGEGGR